VSVTIEQIHNTQKQGLIKELSLSEQIFLQNEQQKLRTTAFLNFVLSLDQLCSFFIGRIIPTVVVSIIVGAPFID
jgi:hypothetical protein